MEDLIKAYGLRVVKLKSKATGNLVLLLTGNSSVNAYALFNSNNEVFAIDGNPYLPIGGRSAFNSLLKDGLDHKGYSFIRMQ